MTYTYFKGCPWSSHSERTAEVYDIFPSLQISSSATAPGLSDFESFLRLIASDTLQAQALIELCVQFGWTKIGVIYINDAYGEGLREEIDEIALLKEIDVKTMAYDNSTKSMNDVAMFIKENKLYINILIVRDIHIKRFFETLNIHKLTGFPYFYIGADAWWVEAEIQANDIMDYVQGFIGTMPGSISMLTHDLYRKLFKLDQDGDMTLYNEVMKKQEWIALRMREDYNVMDQHHNLINFGYDAIYAQAHALNIFNQYHDYSLDSIFSDCNHQNLSQLQDKLKPVRDIFRNILVQNVSFIGATGNVSFHENGDRKGGIFLYGYISTNKSMEIFGGKCDAGNFYIDPNFNQWPADFNGNIPKSHYEANNTEIAAIEITLQHLQLEKDALELLTSNLTAENRKLDDEILKISTNFSNVETKLKQRITDLEAELQDFKDVHYTEILSLAISWQIYSILIIFMCCCCVCIISPFIYCICRNKKNNVNYQQVSHVAVESGMYFYSN